MTLRSYGEKATSTTISFMGSKMHLFEDRDSITEFMKHPGLSSPMSLYLFALRNFFGMPEKSLSVYRTDNSGPHSKPFPNSNVDFRIDYLLHQSFMRAWSGPGLFHTTQSFRQVLRHKISTCAVPSDSWIEVPDFFQFFLNLVSASVTEAVFGSMLLRLNPDFLDDLWAYDDALPWMARGIPAFIMPGPYRIRDRLRAQIKTWHSYARDNFRESDIDHTGGDPFWGSGLVRYLQGVLTERGTHDEDALSAHHLGMIFA